MCMTFSDVGFCYISDFSLIISEDQADELREHLYTSDIETDG